jgi:mevalonate kinase
MPERQYIFQTLAHGKLLLTAEYAVLDGALALALPLRYGQMLQVSTSDTPGLLHWQALEPQETCWLDAHLNLSDFSIAQANEPVLAGTLREILLACRRQRPDFLVQATGLEVTTQTDFPRAWGLGTSSTLIAALAHWSGADPYRILNETIGGSGYDLACAYAQTPVLYRWAEGRPQIEAIPYRPAFAGQLYFVYLERKQDSREGIRRYRALGGAKQELTRSAGELTAKWLDCERLAELEQVIDVHENMISEALELPKAKDLYFSDYWGAVKSLGAWGGDFVLVTSDRSEETTRAYFADRGFPVFHSWDSLVL